MSTQVGSNPASRALASGLGAAISAADRGDREDFDLALARLSAPRADVVDTLLSAVVRLQLEDSHPAGVDEQAVRDVLARTARHAIGWYPQVDVTALVIVLTGALGVLDAPDSGRGEAEDIDADPDVPASPMPDPAQVRAHAVMVVASLASGSGARIDRLLDLALAEVERAETQEMP